MLQRGVSQLTVHTIVAQNMQDVAAQDAALPRNHKRAWNSTGDAVVVLLYKGCVSALPHSVVRDEGAVGDVHRKRCVTQRQRPEVRSVLLPGHLQPPALRAASGTGWLPFSSAHGGAHSSATAQLWPLGVTASAHGPTAHWNVVDSWYGTQPEQLAAVPHSLPITSDTKSRRHSGDEPPRSSEFWMRATRVCTPFTCCCLRRL